LAYLIPEILAVQTAKAPLPAHTIQKKLLKK
jgi:hypothetical protein